MSLHSPQAFEVVFRVPASADHHHCSSCDAFKASGSFVRNQLNNKGPGKQRCIACVKAALEQEETGQAQGRLDKLKDARKATAQAEIKGNVVQKLVAAAAECAAGDTAVLVSPNTFISSALEVRAITLSPCICCRG